jgi:hypothetical protein
MNQAKLTKIAYWAATGLLAAALLMGGISQFLHLPNVSATMTHLGYPTYFSSIIGTWKTLGALALLAPGLGRLKEWAYAGIAFNLSGAALSHLAVGDAGALMVPPLFLLGLAVASYVLRPHSRRLTLEQAPALAPARAAA